MEGPGGAERHRQPVAEEDCAHWHTFRVFSDGPPAHSAASVCGGPIGLRIEPNDGHVSEQHVAELTSYFGGFAVVATMKDAVHSPRRLDHLSEVLARLLSNIGKSGETRQGAEGHEAVAECCGNELVVIEARVDGLSGGGGA